MSVTTIEAYGYPPDFHKTLGQFHSTWLTFDIIVDYSIGKLLRLDTAETHILVSGLEFGRKLRLLLELLKRSNFPKKESLIQNVRIIQSSKRDMITHAYIAASETHIEFIYRFRGAEYGANKLEFSIEEFRSHVGKMIVATRKYQEALAAPRDEVEAFANAALSVRKSTTTSPAAPST